MKSLLDIQRLKIYLWIGLGWLCVWLLNALGYPDSFWPRALNEIWRTPYIIAAQYFFFEYTFRQLSHKKLIRSVFLVGLQIFIYSVGLYLWKQIAIHLHIYTVFIHYDEVGEDISHQMSASMTSLIFFGIIKHIYDYFKLKKSTEQLRIEKQEAELNYLKAQTNPHFLFNTLNNIYSLARDKSDLAPESILRLSKILRYMLYETGGAYIAVEQELKIMKDYIALEELRYDETLRINFNYDVEDMKQALPPLLLIPLVENAFKHGVSETRGRPFVDIHLSINNRQLHFIVKNSSESASGGTVIENIGLSNLRRQLELLFTDYHLFVQQTDSVFTATLKINLASHV